MKKYLQIASVIQCNSSISSCIGNCSWTAAKWDVNCTQILVIEDQTNKFPSVIRSHNMGEWNLSCLHLLV